MKQSSEFFTRVLAVMDEMEGLHGPDCDEYVIIMRSIADEAIQRENNARSNREFAESTRNTWSRGQ